MKLFVTFSLLIVVLCHDATSSDSPCGDWVPFKDEKCFKLVDDTLRTYADAEKTCAHMEGSPSLPIVRSKEEQEYLTNYAFKILAKVEDVWIGAKFEQNHFAWADHSNLTFTNWAKSPHNKPNYCVQLQWDDTVPGKWVDNPCEKKNLVVCQKLQTWSIARLEKTLLDARKELRDGLEAAKKEILLLKYTLEDEIAKKDRELKQNLLPIGFTYVQLPKDKAPAEIWPWAKWTDVSADYAGLFFRVEGGSAALFGSVQEANQTVISDVYVHYSGYDIYDNHGMSLPQGEWSKRIRSGDSYSSGAYSLKFFTTFGEVRPRNMAMRVWKRTA